MNIIFGILLVILAGIHAGAALSIKGNVYKKVDAKVTKTILYTITGIEIVSAILLWMS